ncbi:MAG TPA: class I SAM-dependent methyltransferase [Mycobacteriales bacterium]|nr:class I SAM-dependent methyltransferase [Mycobacteriales bacterium]
MTARSPFDALADSYDAARPTYPDGLYDALPPLRGARVADVGAGTGISTRGLLARGADVVAFDLAPNMLARLRDRGGAGLRGVAVADGHRLPLPDASVDLVTYAQAFHWMRPGEAVREARRVLRPGGALARWWNDSDARGERWWQVQQELLETLNDDYGRDYRVHDPALDLGDVFGEVTVHTVPWVRRLDVPAYLTFLSSKSYVAALGDRLPAFLAAQRALLEEAFPDGVVAEPFVTRLWVAR